MCKFAHDRKKPFLFLICLHYCFFKKFNPTCTKCLDPPLTKLTRTARKSLVNIYSMLYLKFYLIGKKMLYSKFYPRELNSVGRNIAFYMQGPGFESWTIHFSTIKLCELWPLGYLTKKKMLYLKFYIAC